MLNFKASRSSGEVFALWAPAPQRGVAAAIGVIGKDGLRVTEVIPASVLAKGATRRLSQCGRGVLLLSPSLYSTGLVTDPLGVGPAGMKEALRWAFAKDAGEIDMATAEFEAIGVKGEASGGGLLKNSHWIFAIERAVLRAHLRPLISQGLKIEAVDALAMSQRNLCWAQAASGRDGGHVSLVVGPDYSALGIVSRDGDQLFHKQLEWTADTILAPESQERLILDLQRNLGYFERRQSAFGLVQGYVHGLGGAQIAERVQEGLGSLDWTAGAMPDVLVDPPRDSEDGSLRWLIGALRRWF